MKELYSIVIVIVLLFIWFVCNRDEIVAQQEYDTKIVSVLEAKEIAEAIDLVSTEIIALKRGASRQVALECATRIVAAKIIAKGE